MHLYNLGEKEGKALFFSPGKIAQVRARDTDEKQAEE
jgi:hypothetical protein